MKTLYLLLLVFAAVCFIVAAVARTKPDGIASRVNLVALGLFSWVLTQLIPAVARAAGVVLLCFILVGCTYDEQQRSYKAVSAIVGSYYSRPPAEQPIE